MNALLLSALVVFTFTHPTRSQDQPDDLQRLETYFDGLRSRGLYSLAETVCQRKLADQSLGLVSRTRYAVELSQSLTEQSRTVAVAADQAELLSQARRAVKQILETRQNHPQQILLESQIAMVDAFELESLRWRVDLSPYDHSLVEKSLQLADSLIPTLQRLDQLVGEQARNVKPDALDEKLQPYQLRSLQRAIQLRLGVVYLDKARLFPRNTPDRADAIVKASELLRQLARIPSRDQTMWQSQLAYTTTLRLRGTPEAAWAMLNAIREDDPPAKVLDALTVEHVELLVLEDRFTDAADVLRNYQKEAQRLTGPLSFQSARVFLKLSQIAEENNRPDLASELQIEVKRAIQVATTTGNNYWATRARNLLADEQSRSTYGAEVGALVREGESLFASGNISAAAQRYGMAFTTAQNQKANTAAAEIGYTYGSILLKQKHFSDAADVLQLVTQLNPDGPQAADADLLVAWCRGMEFRDAPTPERREAYISALEHHRTTYTKSVTAGEAAWMLAQLQEQRLQTKQALQLYATVPNGHPRYTESMIGVVRCSETILNRLRRLDKSRSEWEPAIVKLLSPYVRTAMDSGSELTQVEAEFFVSTSRMLLTFTKPDFASADRLLERVLVSASATNPSRTEHLPEKLTEMATALRIVSLTGLEKLDEANALLQSTVRVNQDHLTGILHGLESITKLQAKTQQASTAQLQLTAVELAGLDVLSLSDSELDRFGDIIGSALGRSGQTSKAIDVFHRLLLKQPQNTALRRQVAEMMLTSGKPADLKAARIEFGKLASNLKPGTDEWIDARLHVIETSIALQDLATARKLLKVTRLLYPNISNTDLKQRLNDASAALASTD